MLSSLVTQRVPQTKSRILTRRPVAWRWWPWLVTGLTIGGDQATKTIVQASLRPTQSLPVIPGVLHLTYVQNTGAAFGLFRGYSSVFVLFSVMIATWILLELLRRRHRLWTVQLGLSLILGGAIGNLIDRVRAGCVVDFIDVRVWPVFNLADSAISVGVGLLLLQSIKPRRGPGIKKMICPTPPVSCPPPRVL